MIYYRQKDGQLGKVTFDNKQEDIKAVSNPVKLRKELTKLVSNLKPRSAILTVV